MWKNAQFNFMRALFVLTTMMSFKIHVQPSFLPQSHVLDNSA